jgi:hypothetical protein
MADVNEDVLKKVLRDFKERIETLEAKVKKLEASEDDNYYGEERGEDHPYFGGTEGQERPYP